MKTLIVSPCGLPIPAVKGGAVLTLIESLVIQNEKNKKMDLTIISSYDKKAVENSKRYSNTNFIFIKEPKICKLIDSIYEKIYNLSHKEPHNTLKRYSWKFYVLKKLNKILSKNNYDKVIFQNSGYLLNVLKDKKIQENYTDKLYYHLHNDIPNNIKLEYLKSCKLLLISEYLKKKIELIAGKEIADNSMILKNGFDCNKFDKELSQEEKKKIRENLNISNNKKIIIFTGRIVKEKGIEELTNAFVNLNFDDTILVVVGSHNFGEKNTSPFAIKMQKHFENLGDKIRFTGYISYNDIWKYYKIADLAVLPSTWEEPAGLTMLEATVCGVPLITTISGGIPEYLDSSKVTLLKNDENLSDNIEKTIEEIFNNKKEYDDKAKLASEYVKQNYNEEKFYNDFIDCIR